ncbi:MAG: endonuclease domain-containing protein [Fulvivirga sp.]
MENSDSMFYGARPAIFEKAKMLRLSMTQHEKKVWQELKSNKISGLRFKAQHPINTFIADFYCHKIKLVVEIDGDTHNSTHQTEYDQNRTSIMQNLGITVLRFTNGEVENGLTDVIVNITDTCNLLINRVDTTKK